MKMIKLDRTISKNTGAKRKWKYAQSAKMVRFCTDCGKRLRKDDVMICHHCFMNLILHILGEDDKPKENNHGDDEE